MNNRRDDINITNSLISAGANLNYRTQSGYTALIVGKFCFSKLYILNLY